MADDISALDLSTSTAYTGIDLNTLLPSNKRHFARYDGGLTTPGCYEIVKWTVMSNTIMVTSAQMTSMRTSFFEDEAGSVVIGTNFRAVQDLGSRTIKSTADWASAVMDADITYGTSCPDPTTPMPDSGGGGGTDTDTDSGAVTQHASLCALLLAALMAAVYQYQLC